MKVVRRRFTARDYVAGSDARAKLNEAWITSEYMPSHKYGLLTDAGEASPFTYRTLTEAQAAADRKAT